MATPPLWTPRIADSDKPRYVAIADALAADIAAGRLRPGDRLPPQRALAETLGLDFTTAARGYAEAQRRNLIDCRIGAGTFVKAGVKAGVKADVKAGAAAALETAAPACDALAHLPLAPVAAPTRPADLSMNLPPDIDDPALLDRLRRSAAAVLERLPDLLRYQEFGGAAEDRRAGADWLARCGVTVPPERVLVCPGAHSALHATLNVLTRPGDAVCAEELVYPGLRALAAQQGVELPGLPLDGDGVVPDAFDRLCRARKPKALYCNPTLHNPTAVTTSAERRMALIEIARRHDLAIVEDDAYGALPAAPPPPFAALAPERTYYIAGLGKTLGAGLRIAYVAAPDAARVWRLTAALRAATVMASPLTAAMATRWIADGCAADALAFIRAESVRRQALARRTLPTLENAPGAEGFHLWLNLPDGLSRSVFAAAVRGAGVGVVVGDAFALDAAPEAVRLCLGGCDIAALQGGLERIALALTGGAALNAAFL